MPNHVHLLATPREETSISNMMQRLGTTYAQPFNRRHGRTGSLWEGRFRASLIDSEAYLLICMRYIEFNPVRAGMIAHPRDYAWSSYRHNALGDENPIIRPQLIYQRLGKTAASRRAAYRQFCEQQLPEQTLERIRAAANKSWVLGDDRFRAKIGKRLGRPVIPRTWGGDRKSEAHREARETGQT